jgi:hypothetical protein
MHDPSFGLPDVVTAEFWGSAVEAEELERRCYVHRYMVNGKPYEMDGVVWRVRRR